MFRKILPLLILLSIAPAAMAQGTDWAWSATLMRSDGTAGTCTYNQASFAGKNYART